MKSTLDKEYHSFEIKEKTAIEESDGLCPPAFLNEKNEVFDKYYRKITKHVELSESMKEKRRNIFTHEEYPKYFDNENENTQRIPNPLDFENYNDYEKALKDWYTDKVKCYSSALLPTPLSGELYSPIPAKVFQGKPDAAQFRTFKAAQWPLLPNNYFEMLKLIDQNVEIDPEAQFPEQYPKREVIYMKHHISSSPQWMGQQIPQEPVPEFYDTIEEYEEAYKRWATLANEALAVKIPTVEEFEGLANIDIVERAQTEEPPAGVSRIMPEFPFDERIGELVKTAKADESKLQAVFDKIAFKPEDIEKINIECPETHNVFIQGIDAEQYLNDMVEFGEYGVAIESRSPCHPVNLHTFVPDDSSKISDKLFNNEEITIDLISEMAQLSLTDDEIILLIQTKTGEQQYGDKISIILSKQEMFQEFIKRSYKSEDIRFNFSRFLYIIISHQLNASGFKILFGSMGNKLLYSTVELLSLSSQSNVHLYPRIQSEDDKLQTINKLYLYSLLLTIFSNEETSAMYEFLRKECQKLSVRAAKCIKCEEFRNSIQRDLMMNEMNDGTRAALMIVSINAQQLHRVLFGPTFIEWINSFSESKNGIKFIQALSHSPALNALSFLFMSLATSRIAQIFQTITLQTCICLRRVLYNLLEICDDKKLSLGGTDLVDLFQIVSSSMRECVSVIVAPITAIVSSPSIISNNAQPEYQKILSAAVEKMCCGIKGSSLSQFRQQLQALMIFTKNPSCCLTMSTNSELMLAIISHLTSNDSSTAYLSWKFFMILMKDPKAVDKVYESEPIRQSICEMHSQKNDFAFRKLLNFLLHVWNDVKDTSIQKKWADIIQPSMGVIASKLGKKQISKELDIKTRTAIKEFVQFITNSKSPELKQLKEICENVAIENDQTKGKRKNKSQK